MAKIQVRFKSSPPSAIEVERVPCAGEYIAGTSSLFRVLATVFTPGNAQVQAVVFATQDADGKPDELGFLMPDHLAS